MLEVLDSFSKKLTFLDYERNSHIFQFCKDVFEEVDVVFNFVNLYIDSVEIDEIGI